MGVASGGLVSGQDVGVHDQARSPDHVGVVAVGGAPGLVGVVAHLGTLLGTVDGFDGRIDVEDVRVLEQRLGLAQ